MCRVRVTLSGPVGRLGQMTPDPERKGGKKTEFIMNRENENLRKDVRMSVGVMTD